MQASVRDIFHRPLALHRSEDGCFWYPASQVNSHILFEIGTQQGSRPFILVSDTSVSQRSTEKNSGLFTHVT